MSAEKAVSAGSLAQLRRPVLVSAIVFTASAALANVRYCPGLQASRRMCLAVWRHTSRHSDG